MSKQYWISLIAFISCLQGGMILFPQQGLARADSEEFRSLIKEMKVAPRGPFSQIRWFCEDGEILLPVPSACFGHGGGVQHGQLSPPVRALRQAGYLIANVLAAIDVEQFFQAGQWREEFGQILIERFLIDYDDGWIYRGARSYRGALQVEDESATALALQKKLSRVASRDNQDFLLLREAYRLLPRPRSEASVTVIRNLAGAITDSNQDFLPIRSKIHNQPDFTDAQRVRNHAAQFGLDSLQLEYEKLAQLIEQLYSSEEIAESVLRNANTLMPGELRSTLLDGAKILANSSDVEVRLEQAGLLLGRLRQRYAKFRTDYSRLATLKLSLQLEQEVFLLAGRLSDQATSAPRSAQLKWLGYIADAIYGSGLISNRQWMTMKGVVISLSEPFVSLERYRNELRYLNRLPGWASRWLKFHFSESVEKLSGIEPLAQNFIPDRLRSSPLLAYGRIIDGLIVDASKLSGVSHQLFGKSIGTGLRALNPGLARGVLRLPENGQLQPRADSIVLLPETTAELPPVAGILTMGEGNALSHVQLLAGNLGIPNVVISPALQAQLRPMQGHTVVLAVSPGGIVQLEADSVAWHEYFSRQITPTQGLIRPDLERLDLGQVSLLSLAELRSVHAGQVAGPKAANLGELKYHFPSTVTSGLLIPFAVFRAFLEQPYADKNATGYEWMLSEYQRISELGPARQVEANRQFLEKLRHWILTADPDPEFRRQLGMRLQEVFGEDGHYSLFVRSDTNVEDLPGFTGAGLNLTVPNVSGFDNVLAAIQQVWSSPYSERAFAWRQQRMSEPQHVYPSVLLMKSVPVDKSGVMLTLDTEMGERNLLTVAVNHGIGGAVQGQFAEELLIDPVSGDIRLLADATAAKKKVLSEDGGLIKEQLDAEGQVLNDTEIKKLIGFAQALSVKFPQLDDSGQVTAADVEFGFRNGQLVLFQVRPYLKNRRVKKNAYLNQLDKGLERTRHIPVDMSLKPGDG